MVSERNGYIYTSIHDFKTHMSRYIQLLEGGHYRGLMLKRGQKKVVGFFLSVEGSKIWESQHAMRNTVADISAASNGTLEKREEEGWT